MKETATLRLDMVPPMARNICLGNSVVISDNLDAPVPPDPGGGLQERTHVPKNMSFPYRLDFNAILFVVSGLVETRINMKNYRIEDNSIFLTPSDVFLDSLEYRAGTRFLLIGYSNSSLFATMPGRAAAIIRAATYAPLHLPVKKDRMDRYMQILNVLLHVAEGGPDYFFREDIVNGFADIISGGIARIIIERDRKAGHPGRSAEIMKEFMTLVQENCIRERGLDFYARKMCISPKYLSRVVKAVSGKNAGDIIVGNVIPIAQRLLMDGRYNIQQVSNMMNFPNPSYFSRYFLKATGMTPRRYNVMTI